MAHLKFYDGLEVARQVTLNEMDSNAFLNRGYRCVFVKAGCKESFNSPAWYLTK